MLVHTCRRCRFRSRLFRKWLHHLVEQEHQEATRTSFLNWSPEDDLRALVVYAHHKSNPTPSDITEKFASLTCIHDFVYWVNVPHLFIVQLENSGDVEKLLTDLRKNPDDMKIDNRAIQLRRKSDVLQNEWGILVGSRTAKTGLSKSPIYIDLCDGNAEDLENDNIDRGASSPTPSSSRGSGSNGSCVKKTKTVKVKVERDDSSFTNGGQDQGLTKTNGEEPEFDRYDVESRMAKEFKEIFASKFKAEKTGNDEENMNHTNHWMKEKWVEIYYEFHNQIWPICFLMGNNIIDTTAKKGQSYSVKFRCTCLKTKPQEDGNHDHDNSWLEGIYTDEEREELVDSKVKEFCDIVMSCTQTKINRRMAQLGKSQARERKSPILDFTCDIQVDISSDKPKVTAIASISEIQGKNLQSKMDLVTKILKSAFKRYQILKLKQWFANVNGSKNSNASTRQAAWNTVGRK